MRLVFTLAWCQIKDQNPNQALATQLKLVVSYLPIVLHEIIDFVYSSFYQNETYIFNV